MLALLHPKPTNWWQTKVLVSACVLLTHLLFSNFSFAADGRADYDLDDDGLIEINDLADLNEIRNNIDGKTLYGSSFGCPGSCKGFELTTDLDFDTNQDGKINAHDDYWNDGQGWLPSILDYAQFNGNGHAIRHLMINRPSTELVGLFGYINHADIRQVILTEVDVQGEERVGGLVGYAYSTSTLEANGVMGSVSGSKFVGAIVGRMYFGNTVRANFASGTVKGESVVAGLIGHIERQEHIVEGNVSSAWVEGLNYSFTAGLIGYEGFGNYDNLQNNYWAADASGQAESQARSENYSYVGLPLAALRCAVQANTTSTNSNCVSTDGIAEGLTGPVTLYKDWDTYGSTDANGVFHAYWDFGSDQQMPGLLLNGTVYRDSDGDGVEDAQDAFLLSYAASSDTDGDGSPDTWHLNCDTQCRADSGLVLDAFPNDGAVYLDADLDGLPDAWHPNCDAVCQAGSSWVLDRRLLDVDNDGVTDIADNDDGNDGVVDVDIDSDGLIEISSLAQLNAMRYQLDGSGQRLTSGGPLDQSGCPVVVIAGLNERRCFGYELTADLDFDTNQDGLIDSNDDYWNANTNGLGEGWLPVGDSSNNAFTAKFNGNGHVIRHLMINRPSKSRVGLFGFINNADIRQVILTEVDVQGAQSVGGLVGSAGVHNTLEANGVMGSVYSHSSGYGDAGAIAGYINYNNTVRANVASGKVIAEVQYVGGLVGRVGGKLNLIEGNVSSAWVESTYSSNVGGLLGDADYSNNIFQNNYWAINASGQTVSSRSGEANSYVGLPLAALRCAVQANTTSTNSNCVSTDGIAEDLTGPVTLYKDWNTYGTTDANGIFHAYWNFGSDQQMPGLVLNSRIYRDSDGDGAQDAQDAFPLFFAASYDTDGDGFPDAWNLGCDVQCRADLGLELDAFPNDAAVYLDADLDGLPDAWHPDCDTACQSASSWVLDAHLFDMDNDGIIDTEDPDDNNDGVTDADIDNDGLIDISSLAQLDAMRHQLDGLGLRLTSDGPLDQSGCPVVLIAGKDQIRCHGYELTTDLDFDTNQDGQIDTNDDYWNANSDGLGEGWLPVGDSSNAFTGHFNGNGHVIRHLMINRQSTVNVGLFGFINNADIRQVLLTEVNVQGDYNTGGLVGRGVENNTLEANGVMGSVMSVGAAGVIIGGVDDNNILRANAASGKVVTSNSNSNSSGGGLIGYINGQTNLIEGNVSSAWVDSLSDNGRGGGLLGYMLKPDNAMQNNYWANDASGQVVSDGNSETNSYVGLPLAALSCAVQANTTPANSSCVSADGIAEGFTGPITLYKDWDTYGSTDANGVFHAYWDFGSDQQVPALNFNGMTYRDSDGDGVIDAQDAFPLVFAAYHDADEDGSPDAWSLGCDAQCRVDSGLALDAFPNDATVYLDADFDGLPDALHPDCDAACQLASSWVLDTHLFDVDNDGIIDTEDPDDNNDGVTDADIDNDGLIEISSLAQLDSMRYQLGGLGKRLTSDGPLDQSGCPVVVISGVNQKRCFGYELVTDLDFDTNQDGLIDVNDDYWNAGAGWLPVGEFSNKFTAHFNGNGHVIRHLMINRTSSGLFGYIAGADIRQVILTEVDVQARNNVGGLVGAAYNNNNILEANVVMGSVYSYGSSNSYTGAIAGVIFGNNTVLRSNVASGKVTSAGKRVGGLIGYVNGQLNVIEGNVSSAWVDSPYLSDFGGLLGEMNGSNNILKNNYWTSHALGQASVGETNSNMGLPLAALRCAVQANTTSANSNCVSADGIAEGLAGPATLYNDWDTYGTTDANGVFHAYWDFGSDQQMPALNFNGTIYRDSDGDGVLDAQDALPLAYAASSDTDGDGSPDAWGSNCDVQCRADSVLALDAFPNDGTVYLDADLDGSPDTWHPDCDNACQAVSSWVLDTHLFDTDNDGISDIEDTDDNGDGVIDVDSDSNGLIEISSLAQLDAMRHQLDGSGQRLTSDGPLDQSGCPVVVISGVNERHCHGYELTTDLDFDTNQDGLIDVNDDYWNANSDGLGEGWLPVGGSYTAFTGYFNGNGHVIRHLMINRPSTNKVGLFGYIKDADIRQVMLTEVDVQAGNAVGGLVGYAGDHNTLEANGVMGSVYAHYSYSGDTGAIAGYINHNNTVRANVASGKVEVKGYSVGGLIGDIGKYNLIEGNVSSALVEASPASSVGGLLGSSNFSNSILQNNYWAIDASGQAMSEGSSETNSYVGLPLAALRCAVQANTTSTNSNCVSTDGISEGLTGPFTLYKDWDTYGSTNANGVFHSYWDFGSDQQLPGLVLNGTIYRDSDGDGSIDENDDFPFDSDNDGISNLQDVYPFIALGELLDTDNDGVPNTCDADCLALGMTADIDDDNDGILDADDAYPQITLGDLLDTDGDGIPNECDESCIALGMTADTDNDNDGVLDSNDVFPFIAIGELLDTDNDGAPDTCDVDCLALGMAADIDGDNDGVPDSQDAYPLISLGDRLDADSDGIPNECDESCVSLGMVEDKDDDNDGILDAQDAYPFIALGDRLDTDGDGIPNECDESCTSLDMAADNDDDNDGVLDAQDVYPLIAIGELLDSDNDGAPDTCDVVCLALGMTADLDDDNDGVFDTQDAYPLISLGDRLDTDGDGIPNECDETCIALEMIADADDDDDDVLDAQDTYPLISLEGRLDTDGDGIPNECDESCTALKMAADTDDDNDGVLDAQDVYPLITIGELVDSDNDGAPDTCDVDCLALGMVADLDNDNDGVFDSQDAYPLIPLGDRLDTDSDGIPNECDESCVSLGMVADTDDDNDGILDAQDAYPLIALGDRLDTDSDGIPNECDESCVSLGMVEDTDDDNDGVLDTQDTYPLISLEGRLDTDGDGIPNQCDESCIALEMIADTDDDNDGVSDINDRFPLDSTEHSDFDNDGLGNTADLDDDNDGVNDVDDPNLGADNGAPEIIYVPSIEPVAVTTENGEAFELLVDDNFLSYFTTTDAVDTEFTYEASLNGSVLAIDENGIMLIPAGRQAIQVVAIDTSGNRSDAVELIAIVYPQVRFEQATSIIGENIVAEIKVSLTGDAPEYPVVVNFSVNESSDVQQADLESEFDITAEHQVIIAAGDAETLNRDGFIMIPIIEDSESENDELLIIDLMSVKLERESDEEIESLFIIDDESQQHELTVTYQNLAPVVSLKLEQNGIEVVSVQQDGGAVSVTATVQDGNGSDEHTFTWDLNNLDLSVPLGNTLNFDPANLPATSYEISVLVTDNGIGQLADNAEIKFEVVAARIDDTEPHNGDEITQPASGGALSLWFVFLLFGLMGGMRLGSRR